MEELKKLRQFLSLNNSAYIGTMIGFRSVSYSYFPYFNPQSCLATPHLARHTIIPHLICTQPHRCLQATGGIVLTYTLPRQAGSWSDQCTPAWWSAGIDLENPRSWAGRPAVLNTLSVWSNNLLPLFNPFFFFFFLRAYSNLSCVFVCAALCMYCIFHLLLGNKKKPKYLFWFVVYAIHVSVVELGKSCYSAAVPSVCVCARYRFLAESSVVFVPQSW